MKLYRSKDLLKNFVSFQEELAKRENDLEKKNCFRFQAVAGQFEGKLIA